MCEWPELTKRHCHRAQKSLFQVRCNTLASATKALEQMQPEPHPIGRPSTTFVELERLGEIGAEAPLPIEDPPVWPIQEDVLLALS